LCLPKKKYFLLPHGDFTYAFFFPYKILNEAIYKGLGLGFVENDPPKVVHYRPLDPQNASKMLLMCPGIQFKGRLSC